MRKDLLPYYLRNLVIKGFEETEAEKAARLAKEAEDNEDEDEDEDEEDDEKEGKKKPEDNSALKSALQKERNERKKLARENKALAKFKEEAEGKDKNDTDKAKDEAAKEKSKTAKLATRLKDQAVDNAILRLGGKLKFRDMDDALKLVDRSDIDVEQDEDDPDEVEVDDDTVTAALEKLAKAKPHLIAAEGQEDKSGSKFNGGNKPKKEVEDDALRSKYSALNRSGIQ